MNRKKLSLISVAVSTLLLIVLVNMWIEMNKYEVQPTQLVNEQATNDYLYQNWKGSPESPTIKIKTGIFIDSFKFFDSSEVNISGYIWQKYTDGIHDAVKPKLSEIGFILPEQVNSGSDIDPREVYRVRTGNVEVIGWYFEATLRQPFDYAHYPFDHKTVWVRLWAKNFSQNVVLVPDFAAYKATGLADIFGIEDKIVMGTWERKNTYFNYQLANYSTDFGIPDYVGYTGFPELHYNFVVKRKFENAFIVYLLPLFLVTALLFAALLTVSTKPELSDRHGFSTSGFIGTSSTLFFVVMLAHIQLRGQFAGSSIVYIEYFYIIMYALLVSATASTYLFSIRPKNWFGFILYDDNILVKAGYWPVVFLCMICITFMVM